MNVVVVIISDRGHMEAVDELLSEFGWAAGNLTVRLSQTGLGETTHLGLCATVPVAQAQRIMDAFQDASPDVVAHMALSRDVLPRQHFESVLDELGLREMRRDEP